MSNTNPTGTFTTLQDAAGIPIDVSQGQVIGVALNAALTGSLTISGVRNLDGTAASWVINAAANGWQSPAGNSSGLCARVSYVLSNPGADAGKAALLWSAK